MPLISSACSTDKVAGEPQITVRQLFEDYMKAEGHKLRSSVHRRQLYYRHIDKAIGSLNVESLTKRSVLNMLDDLLKYSPSQARQARTIIKRVFSWLETCGPHQLDLPRNPVSNLPAIPMARSRDRYLDESELALLLRLAERDQSSFLAGLYLILHTGVRRSEAFGAEWVEINFERGVWIIPSTRTKTAVELVLPLPPGLIHWLASRQKRQGGAYQLLFPGRDTTKLFSGYSKALTRVRGQLESLARDIGVELRHWTIHDIRRSVASGMHSLMDQDYRPRIQAEVVERILNHSQPKMSKIYNRFEYFAQKRNALVLWEQHLRLISERT